MLRTAFIVLLFIPFLSFCQQRNAVNSSIDSIVLTIDGLSKENGKSYTKEKTLRNKKITEQWLHFGNKKISFISIEYKIDSTAFTEKYYLQNGSLIYAFENEI
jgi:hypothetical protein